MASSTQSGLFAGDFSALRARFVTAARTAGASLVEYSHPLHGPSGEPLTTDVAYLGRRDAKKLLVLISGTHGVEGPYGSACQTAWFSQNSPWHLPDDTAVLAIHLINPWGTAWSRRVNEDNVDLNRNFIDWQKRRPKNERYGDLHPLLICPHVDGTERERIDEAYEGAKTKVGGYHGLAPIIEAGQYDYPDGLFYGGSGPVWSNETLHDILSTFAQNATNVVVFDLHTGAGPYAYPALLSVAEGEHTGLDWGREIFGPALSVVITGASAETDTGIAATATGYVSAAVRKAIPDARVLPLVIECGTLEGEAVSEAVKADNWLHLYGKIDTPQGDRIKENLRAAFIPDDVDWRNTCLSTSLRHFDRAFATLKALGGSGVEKIVPASASVTVLPNPHHEKARHAENPAVEVHGIHKRFGPLEVLKGVDVTAKRGEVVSMIGSSGSGKSTFLRCINMLEQPNEGRIVIDGEEIRMKHGVNGGSVPADIKQVERMRSRVGMVFQNFNLWPHMTVLENIIEAPVQVRKERKSEAVDHAHALLKKVGLSEKHAHYPGQLSGGQQQRAAIARTLAMRPKLILLDEPTSALDPELVGEVLRVIRQLAEEGNTMILVTHEMQFAREVSHKILFLHQGKVEEEGAPAELFNTPRSERLRQFLSRAR
jgi:octopine/nopaline transport system ATP-binding protein